MMLIRPRGVVLELSRRCRGTVLDDVLGDGLSRLELTDRPSIGLRRGREVAGRCPGGGGKAAVTCRDCA